MERSKYVAQNKRISLVRCEILTKCTSASSNNKPGKHSEIKVVVLNNQAKFFKIIHSTPTYAHNNIHYP
jgi:hypothetical protein